MRLPALLLVPLSLATMLHGASGSDVGPAHVNMDDAGNVHLNTSQGQGRLLLNGRDITTEADSVREKLAAEAAANQQAAAQHARASEDLEGLAIARDFLQDALKLRPPSVLHDISFIAQGGGISHNSIDRVVADKQGNFVYGVGRTKGDTVNVHAYATDGSPAWGVALGSGHFIHGLALSDDGQRLYLAGVANGALNGLSSDAFGCFVACLNVTSSGAVIWTKAYDDLVFINGLALGSDGALYLAGTTDTSFDGNTHIHERDIAVARLNPDNGQVLWSTQLGGAGSDSAEGIAVDGRGNIFVTGYTDDSSFLGGGDFTKVDAFVFAFRNTSNNPVWGALLGTRGDDYARDIVADKHGNVYVTGSTTIKYHGPEGIGVTASHRFFVVRMNGADGKQTYSKLAPSFQNIYAFGIAIDPTAEYLAITGATEEPMSRYKMGGSKDLFAIKMRASTGAVVWSTQLAWTEYSEGRCVAFGPSHNDLYVGGFVRGEPGDLESKGAGQTTGQSDFVLIRLLPPQ